MFKIALSAGHGFHTSGKRCPGYLDPHETREWYLNDRICDKIEQKLTAYAGYELIRLDDTTGQTDVPLKDRTSKANNFKADFYLSIHHNAGVGGKSGGGVVAYVYPGVGNVTLDWQKALYDAVIKHTGLRGNRAKPLAQSNLHEVRESNMPAVLLECGFMDSSTDVPIILSDDFANKVATACVEVLVAKGGLTEKNIAVKPAPVVPANSLYFEKYVGDTCSIVTALNSLGVASTYAYRSKIAKANGIKYYMGTAKQNTAMLNLLKQGKLIKP